jgi:hypothetical protein
MVSMVGLESDLSNLARSACVMLLLATASAQLLGLATFSTMQGTTPLVAAKFTIADALRRFVRRNLYVVLTWYLRGTSVLRRGIHERILTALVHIIHTQPRRSPPASPPTSLLLLLILLLLLFRYNVEDLNLDSAKVWSPGQPIPDDVAKLIQQLLNNLDLVADRKAGLRGKTFKSCFPGMELVTWLVSDKCVLLISSNCSHVLSSIVSAGSEFCLSPSSAS